MTYYVIIKPQAEYDLLECVHWYENQKEGLGISFLLAIEDKFQVIVSNPL
jgi:hypothetical protein